MNVLILANYDRGLYLFRRELIEELLKKHRVFVSVPDGDCVGKLTEMGCTVIRTKLSRRGTDPIEDLKLMKEYLKIIRETSASVVLTYTIKPNVYGGIACQLRKVPYIANITGLGTALENPGVLQLITKNLYKAGLRKAQKVFFQNEANRDFMREKGIVTDRYDLIPGSGVNLDSFPLMEYPDTDETHFVYIGRIMKQKGFDQYADAARHFRGRKCFFHVCGFCEEGYSDILNGLIEDGTIIYHGNVDDMRPIYQMISCTVHPTYYPEGMSNVLLESLACGRPIITTDRPGCREIVEDGVNGFVVKERDSEDLIDKIEKFLKLSREERKELGIRGRKKVESCFDRKIVIDKYLKEIECLDR